MMVEQSGVVIVLFDRGWSPAGDQMGNRRSIHAIMRINDDDRHAERVDPTIVGSPRLIYADGRHNIAPDVTRWKGQYYLTFSNGSNHRVWDHRGIVMRCDNLRDWTKSYHTPHQARDPFFCAMPDRLLMYYIHYENPHDIKHGWPPERTVETKVTYTDDGETWSAPQRVYERGANFWRPKMRDGRIYVGADTLVQEDGTLPEEGAWAQMRRVLLLESEDGLNWSQVSQITRAGTETELHFRPDGDLWALTRHRWFSRAKPPYTTWQTKELPRGHGFGGPAMIEVKGTVYAAGRYYNLPRDEGKNQATAIWIFDTDVDNFRLLTFMSEPGFYDQSYPTFITHNDDVYMVYYSSYRYKDIRDWEQNGAPLADIVIARLNLPS